MKRILAAAAAALLLTGCGGNDLQGEVTGKQHKPGYMWLMPIPHTTCSGNPQVCTTTYTYIPQWVPDCYEITVKGEESGSTCLGSAEEWDSVAVGDSYTGPDVDPKDRAEDP